MEYENLLTINWTLVFQWVNLLILFIFVKKFLFGRVNEMFEERKTEIEGNFTEAEQANAKAKELEQTYTEQIKGARLKADEIVQTATQVASEKGDEIVQTATQEANTIVQKAQKDIEKQKQVALQEVKGEISDIALALASKVIEKDLNSENHDSMVDEFLENVGDFKWEV